VFQHLVWCTKRFCGIFQLKTEKDRRIWPENPPSLSFFAWKGAGEEGQYFNAIFCLRLTLPPLNSKCAAQMKHRCLITLQQACVEHQSVGTRMVDRCKMQRRFVGCHIYIYIYICVCVRKGTHRFLFAYEGPRDVRCSCSVDAWIHTKLAYACACECECERVCVWKGRGKKEVAGWGGRGGRCQPQGDDVVFQNSSRISQDCT